MISLAGGAGLREQYSRYILAGFDIDDVERNRTVPPHAERFDASRLTDKM
jgi:hypothetical protein